MPLAECCEIVSGATPSTAVESYWGGEICWATPKDLSDLVGHFISDTPRKLTKEGLRSCAASVLPPSSVLLSSRAPIGHVAINTVPIATNQGFKSLVPRAGIVDTKFLFHWLRANRSYLEGLGVGATFKEISKAIVSKIRVPVPPFAEQRRIAAILDQADSLRAKRREALALLDELQRGIFVEMFGDPVCGNGHHPVASVESIAASEKYSIVDGPFGSSMKPDDYRDSGVPVVRIANITKDGQFSDKNLLYIEKSQFEKLKRSSIRPRDVLVSRVGTIGNTCVFPEGIGDALLSTTGVCKITPDAKKMLPEFLHQAILQPAFQEQIQKSASTSVQKYFNLSALKRWSVIVPPISVQSLFVERILKVSVHRELLKRSLEDLDALFCSLQHRAFRGEL